MSSTQDVSPPSPQTVRPGLIHSASTDASAQVLGDLLRKDYVAHHCFFNAKGFHNHLGHHLVAAYDLGAPPALLKIIYEDEAPAQRPVDRQGEDITEANWTTRLGQEKAYGSYLVFFSDQIAKNGVQETLRKWVMAPEANGNDAFMLGRLLGGALHPFLQVGFGVEFGQDYMFSQGLALAAVTSPEVSKIVLDMPSGIPKIEPTSKGVTLLSLLREVYDSPTLEPILPYDPDALLMSRVRKIAADPERSAAFKRIYAKWSIDTTVTGAAATQEFAAKAEECLWQATLLVAATGKPNRAPRLDFFLMHVLTSAICLPSMVSLLSDPVHKAQLLQGYARVTALYVILRGRPRIDIPLLMSYSEFPRPPAQAHVAQGGADALGDPRKGGETDPWLAIVQNALHHKDSHVVKAIRSLYYGAQRYGQRAAGGAIGARDELKEGKETHVGAGEMDGTIFVRAAGVVSDTLGWVAFGEKEGDWDRSALGWDAAWDSEKTT
ncbi:hypothetical protein C8F04DRAFT_987792 [Mycena alexandri]|uniref:Oxidoreductase AflY n=1 Tax=Mycena alexandri TaxID=1745969 RepID=A0AAD6TLM4_9AGAR|nr:hypothetical protein C8F04DRAFT_987792 [Mycena alexandri]